jgi:hypothetical protein
MIASNASFAEVPKTKLAAIKALQRGINSVPTFIPNAEQTIMA